MINYPSFNNLSANANLHNRVICDDAETIEQDKAAPVLREKRSPTPVLSQIGPFHRYNQSIPYGKINRSNLSPEASGNSTVSINFIFRFFRDISQNKWKELHAPAVLQRNINRSGNLLKEIKNEVGGEVFTNTSVGFNLNRKDIIHSCITFLAQQEKGYMEKIVTNNSDANFFQHYHHILDNKVDWTTKNYQGNYISNTSMLNVRAFNLLPSSIRDKFSTISDDLIYYGNSTNNRPEEKRRLTSSERKSMLMILLNHIAYQIKISRDSIHNLTPATDQNSEKEKMVNLMNYQIEVMSEFYVSHLSTKKTESFPDEIYFLDKVAVTHFSGLVGQLDRFRSEQIIDIVNNIFTNITTYTSALKKINDFQNNKSSKNDLLDDSFVDALYSTLESATTTIYKNGILSKSLSPGNIRKINTINDKAKKNRQHYNGEFYDKLRAWMSSNNTILQSRKIEDKKVFVDIKNLTPPIFNWKQMFCNNINEIIKSFEEDEDEYYLDDNHHPLNSQSLIYIIINQRMNRAESFLKRLFPFTDFAEKKWQNANNFSDTKKAIRITIAEAVALYRKWNPTTEDFNALILDKKIRTLVDKISTKTALWESDLLNQVDNLKYDLNYQLSSYNVLKNRMKNLENVSKVDIYTKKFDVNLTRVEKDKINLFFKGKWSGYLVKLNNDIERNQRIFPGILCIPLRKGNGTHDGYESVLISLNHQDLVRLPALLGPERVFTVIKNFSQVDADKRHHFLDNLASRRGLHEKTYQQIDRDIAKLRTFLANEMSTRQIPDETNDYLTFVEMKNINAEGPASAGPKQYSFYESKPFIFEAFSFTTNASERRVNEITLMNSIIDNKNIKLRDEIDNFIFTADNNWFTWDEREIRNTKEWMDMFIIIFSIGSVLLPTPNLSFTSSFFVKYLPFTMLDLFANVNSALLGKRLATNYDELKSSEDDLYKSIFYWGTATLSGAAISISTSPSKMSNMANSRLFIRKIYKDAIAEPTFITHRNWDYLLSRMYGELSYSRSLKSAFKNALTPQHSLFYDMIDYSYLQITPIIRDESTINLALKNNILAGESSISNKIIAIEENIKKPETALKNIAADLKNLDSEFDKMHANAILAKNHMIESTERYQQLSELIDLMPALKSRTIELEKILSQTIVQLNSLPIEADLQRIKSVFQCSEESAREINEHILAINRKRRSINVGDLYRISHTLGGGSKTGDNLLNALRELSSVAITSLLNKTPEMLIVDGVTGYLDLYHKLFPLSNRTTQREEVITGNSTNQELLHNLLGFWQPPQNNTD